MNEKSLRPAGQNRLDAGPHPEPPTGIDPVTSFLPRTRSTTELGGQRVNTLPEDSAPNKSAGLPRSSQQSVVPRIPGVRGGSGGAVTAGPHSGCDEADSRVRRG